LQVLDIEKPQPQPYRPAAEVPLFIRRNFPRIQSLALVDGQNQDLLVKQPESLKLAAKAQMKTACAASVLPLTKKIVNEPIRLRLGKFWK
jgi:hypothetical protein